MEENFIKYIEQSIKDHWDLPALTDFKGATSSYKDVARKIEKLHLLFEHCGIRKGDKIALCSRNTSSWGIAFLVTLSYGAVAVPILNEFKPDNVHHIVNHSEARLLFAGDVVWENLDESAMPDLDGVLRIEDYSLRTSNSKQLTEARARLNELFGKKFPDRFRAEDVHYEYDTPDQLAVINYTSGTTGFSKGVMLTGNNLAGNVTFGIRTELLKKGDKVLSFLPLAHAYGCAFDFLTATAVGTHVTLLGKVPSPKILMKAFEEVKPNLIITVPLVIEKIYKNVIQPIINKKTMKWALSIPLLDGQIYGQIRKKLIDALGGRFKEVIIGGAAMNPEVEEFFHRIKFPFTIGYGMTECAPLISYAPWNEFVPTSSGRVLDIMEARICKENPDDKLGEIQVRGENVMTGYYKNPEATKEVFTEDGWLRTGDLGTLDDDNNLYIRGRSKTMILSSSGQNIFPEEIEARLNNMPFVLESLVIERNKRLVALVYADYEALDSLGLNQPDNLKTIMDENLKNLNNNVAAYEKVSKIQLYPTEFEKTPKRSIKRYLYNSIAVD